MNIATETAPAPDLAAVKTKQQVTWSTGDYPAIGTTVQIVGERTREERDAANERLAEQNSEHLGLLKAELGRTAGAGLTFA